MLMHTGSMGISAQMNNFLHIVINNSSHDSVGGQPTLGKILNLKEMVKVLDIKCVILFQKRQLIKILNKCINSQNQQ